MWLNTRLLNGKLSNGQILIHSELSAAGAQLLLKQLMDWLGSLVLLILFAPIFIVIAVLIKLQSPGPVFYVHDRVGLNQEAFPLLKFRTMRVGTELEQERLSTKTGEGPFFGKIKDDPRVFPIGRFLRRSSLDELPQLINVLKAEMSLVGPRPLVLIEAKRFNQWNHLKRFSMKPGISGLWQVNGRSQTSARERLAYDLEYVMNWSLKLDLRILLETIPAVLTGRGAD